MRQAQRLKRIFNIDIETCGGADKVIARIEDPVLIKTILTQRNPSGSPRVGPHHLSACNVKAGMQA